ncbi:hypothetical protein [Micromonospora sp. NBRC 101691]|uniref:hypothetical protein n=1 Tax=Micromonospora sp. NBRC 101691 TaxID=3032198 RepID=UPI00249FA7D2|nr:hypothetical protein [Micromonospora sp. NBRC 101691]GLY21690.1 hypothetical protein Misp04_14220 [Micromonospora sp. NBRC 101691]
MSDNSNRRLVVRGGYVTVKRKVGAGMAYVDIPAGQELPDDVSAEERDALVASGAVGPADDDTHDDERTEAAHTAPDGTPVDRPVAGEVEPDEIDPDVIPGGSTEQIMAWIGDDLARARVARHEEKAKGDKARAGLIDLIEQRMAELESEPPAVPESWQETNPGSATGGGVVEPVDDPGAGSGKPASRTRKN